MKVYLPVYGQVDNLGDSVLRRGYLDTMRSIAPLNVYAGGKPAGYRSGLGLTAEDTVFEDLGEWRRAAAGAMWDGDAIFAFDTGETMIPAVALARYARQAALIGVGSARGSLSAHIGIGIRSKTRWTRLAGVAMRGMTFVTWRDTFSRDAVGVGRVQPDWAFALGSADSELERVPQPGERTHLALCIRAGSSSSPRPELGEVWFESVRRIARETSLTPIVVTQVRRDTELAIEIARRLDCEVILWESDDHAQHEERVRATYRRSAIVMGDRLHGLIIAATEGCVPIGLAIANPDKVDRILSTVGIDGIMLPRALDDPDQAVALAQRTLERRPEIMGHVIQARQDLADVQSSIRARVPEPVAV